MAGIQRPAAAPAMQSGVAPLRGALASRAGAYNAAQLGGPAAPAAKPMAAWSDAAAIVTSNPIATAASAGGSSRVVVIHDIWDEPERERAVGAPGTAPGTAAAAQAALLPTRAALSAAAVTRQSTVVAAETMTPSSRSDTPDARSAAAGSAVPAGGGVGPAVGPAAVAAPAGSGSALPTRRAAPGTATRQSLSSASVPNGSAVWVGASLRKVAFRTANRVEERAFRVLRGGELASLGAAAASARIMESCREEYGDEIEARDVYLAYYRTKSGKRSWPGLLAGSGDTAKLVPLRLVQAITVGHVSPVFSRNMGGVPIAPSDHCLSLTVGSRSLDLICATAAQCADWVAGLRAAMSLVRSSARGPPAGNAAPTPAPAQVPTPAPEPMTMPPRIMPATPSSRRAPAAQSSVASPQLAAGYDVYAGVPLQWDAAQRLEYCRSAMFAAVRGGLLEDVVLLLEDGAFRNSLAALAATSESPLPAYAPAPRPLADLPNNRTHSTRHPQRCQCMQAAPWTSPRRRMAGATLPC
jgi:hypothetical protein